VKSWPFVAGEVTLWRWRGAGRDEGEEANVPWANVLLTKALSASWRRGGCGLAPELSCGTRCAPLLPIDCCTPISKGTAVSDGKGGPRPQARDPPCPSEGAGTERPLRRAPRL
jgi:hypothetical protein